MKILLILIFTKWQIIKFIYYSTATEIYDLCITEINAKIEKKVHNNGILINCNTISETSNESSVDE